MLLVLTLISFIHIVLVFEPNLVLTLFSLVLTLNLFIHMVIVFAPKLILITSYLFAILNYTRVGVDTSLSPVSCIHQILVLAPCLHCAWTVLAPNLVLTSIKSLDLFLDITASKRNVSDSPKILDPACAFTFIRISSF